MRAVAGPGWGGGANRRIPAWLVETEDVQPYECDGLPMFRRLPMAVALPETEVQVQQVLRTCHAMRVPVVVRGAAPPTLVRWRR